MKTTAYKLSIMIIIYLWIIKKIIPTYNYSFSEKKPYHNRREDKKLCVHELNSIDRYI